MEVSVKTMKLVWKAVVVGLLSLLLIGAVRRKRKPDFSHIKFSAAYVPKHGMIYVFFDPKTGYVYYHHGVQIVFKMQLKNLNKPMKFVITKKLKGSLL